MERNGDFFIPPAEVFGAEKVATFRQPDKFGCCAASVHALLSTLGIPSSYPDLYKALKTSKEGVGNTAQIIQVLADNQVNAQEFSHADLPAVKAVLISKIPVLVHIQAPNSDYSPAFLAACDRERLGKCTRRGHYCLVFAADLDALGNVTKLWLMDSFIDPKDTKYGLGIRVMSAKWFLQRWTEVATGDRWMLAASKATV